MHLGVLLAQGSTAFACTLAGGYLLMQKVRLRIMLAHQHLSSRMADVSTIHRHQDTTRQLIQVFFAETGICTRRTSGCTGDTAFNTLHQLRPRQRRRASVRMQDRIQHFMNGRL
jgi:hypothetical protein